MTNAAVDEVNPALSELSTEMFRQPSAEMWMPSVSCLLAPILNAMGFSVVRYLQS